MVPRAQYVGGTVVDVGGRVGQQLVEPVGGRLGGAVLRGGRREQVGALLIALTVEAADQPRQCQPVQQQRPDDHDEGQEDQLRSAGEQLA